MAKVVDESPFEQSSRTVRILSEQEQTLLNSNSATKLSEFKRNKLEIDAKRHWDIFYKNNGANFFKDRNWLEAEFTSLTQSAAGDTKEFRLLEVGCGVGNTAFPLLDKFQNLVVAATDFSPRAVDLVIKRAQDHGYDRMCKAFVSDLSKPQALTTHVDANSFNFVTAIFVLSALSPDTFPTAIENIKSTLLPDGIVFFRDYAVNDHAMLRFKKGKCIQERFYMRQDGTRAYFFTLDELSELVTQAGGKVIKLEYILRKTINKAENVNVPRVFVQGLFKF